MRKAILLALTISAVFALHTEAAERPWRRSAQTCQILDKVVPTYELSMGYIPISDYEGGSDTDIIELDAQWEFAYFRNAFRSGGNMDLRMELHDSIFTDDADLDLPSQAGRIVLNAGWVWRYANGVALQTRLMPGFYTDMSEVGPSAFYVPVSAAVIRSFNSHLSGIAGFEYRPKFETAFMPIFGVEWEINDIFRVEARVPESRLACFMNPDWTAYGAFEWQNFTYTLDDSRDRITFEDFRTVFGLSYRMSDNFLIYGEIGRSFNRSVEFEEVNTNDIDVDDTPFGRVGLSGPF